MKNIVKSLLSLTLAMGTAGCNDFLSGPGVDQDPNSILNLSRPGPLYIGIQAAQSVQFEGQLARLAAEYTQQVSGFSRQSIGFDRYGMDPVTIDPEWIAVYGSNRTLGGGGGLLDIRKMQQLARKLGDSTYIGIGKVYEALVMGMAADLWGDVPYREAADSTNETPAFDSQLQVYADVLAQLDSAITIYLPAASASNLGPPQDNAELIYGGRSVEDLRTTYTQVAHTLKARYYLHLAEGDPSNYANALAEVPLGISSPANDFNWYHDATPNGNNIWYQFYAARCRPRAGRSHHRDHEAQDCRGGGGRCTAQFLLHPSGRRGRGTSRFLRLSPGRQHWFEHCPRNRSGKRLSDRQLLGLQLR